MADPQPRPEYEPAPCPQCGALNATQAETMCKQTQDWTGEYTCDGEFNEQGVSVAITAASLKALDDWCDRMGRKDDLQKS